VAPPANKQREVTLETAGVRDLVRFNPPLPLHNV
jgi:hypothetical protein